MIRINFIRFVTLTGLLFTLVNVRAQEIPIAVGSDSSFASTVASDGVNYLIPILGDSSSPNSVTAQLISYPGTLVGQRISLGAEGTFPGAISIFDGTNYFLIWSGLDGVLKGQLISTSGTLVGSSFIIANNVSIIRQRQEFNLAYVENHSLVVFVKTDNFLYGQIVDKSGNLVGGQIPISGNFARELSIAYDGTNYLVTWVENVPQYSDKDIYGQFVSKSGSLMGNNLLIDGGPNYSDNPTSLAFDGTRYLLVYHDKLLENGNWFIMGRFITTSGAIEETITICDSSLDPFIASVAFDNENYFITWTQLTDMTLRGQFYNKSGLPIDTSFVVISPSVDKSPVGGVGFGGGLYLVVGTKVDSNLSDGDVYARFISPLTTGVDNEINLMPDKITLYQNYPNPFNPNTRIDFDIPKHSYVEVVIYNVLGEQIKKLLSSNLTPGKYNLEWDSLNNEGLAVSSGIYIYYIKANSHTISKKMILLR